MLDVAVRNLTVRHALRDVTLTFPLSTHTALVGPPACGTSTLLRRIAGTQRPDGVRQPQLPPSYVAAPHEQTKAAAAAAALQASTIPPCSTSPSATLPFVMRCAT